MKQTIFFLGILLSPLLVVTQNNPACDSVEIDCCFFNTITPNTVSIEVSNYSSNIFPYPGFIMFDNNMDTVAIETVNYYGIGWDQVHFLEIIQSFDLPFEGILELHTGFYENLECTFPFTIPDTVQTSIHSEEFAELSVYPNPVKDFLTVELKNQNKIYGLQITDLNGRIVRDFSASDINKINVSDLRPGMYFIILSSIEDTSIRKKFIIK